MKEIIIKIIKIFFTIYLIAVTIIAIDGLTVKKNIKNTKYAIVYGSKVEQNGKVSERLKARLDKSIELLKNKKVEKIIVSGGNGQTEFNEAEIMRKYLISKKVKIPKIIIDKNGNTTKLTSKNSYRIIKEKGDYPNIGVVGVSQFFHCSRVKLSLKKAGFSNVYCVSPDYFELRDIYSIIREVPAYIKYYFDGFGDELNIDKKDLKIIGEKVVEKVRKEIK